MPPTCRPPTSWCAMCWRMVPRRARTRHRPPSRAGAGARASARVAAAARSLSAPARPTMSVAPTARRCCKAWKTSPLWRSANHAPVLKVHIENDMHLVRLEPGRLEFRPSPRAPRTLAGDLQQKLRDWTGVRWSVSISSEGGAPTLAEAEEIRQGGAHRKRDAGADGARRAGPFPRRRNRGGARCRSACRSNRRPPKPKIDGLRFRNRAPDPVARQAARPGAALGAARGAGAAEKARPAAGAAGRGDAGRGGGDQDLRNLRQSRHHQPLRHLPRSPPRSAYSLRGGRCRRSVGAGAGRRVSRPLSCAGRGACRRWTA